MSTYIDAARAPSARLILQSITYAVREVISKAYHLIASQKRRLRLVLSSKIHIPIRTQHGFRLCVKEWADRYLIFPACWSGDYFTFIGERGKVGSGLPPD